MNPIRFPNPKRLRIQAAAREAADARRYGNAVAMLDKTMMRYTHPCIISTFFDNADLYGIKSGAGSGGLKRRKGSCKEKGSPHSESY